MVKTLLLILIAGIQLVVCKCPPEDILLEKIKICLKVIGEFLYADEGNRKEHCPAMGRAIECLITFIDECKDNVVLSHRRAQLEENIDSNKKAYMLQCNGGNKIVVDSWVMKCVVSTVLLTLFFFLSI